jgi:hypothetical protein
VRASGSTAIRMSVPGFSAFRPGLPNTGCLSNGCLQAESRFNQRAVLKNHAAVLDSPYDGATSPHSMKQRHFQSSQSLSASDPCAVDALAEARDGGGSPAR